jgi:hypothetical protein
MADRPILFSAPMVRALLEGRKTQTRRLFKPRGFKFYTHPVSGDRYDEYRPYRDGSWDESRISGSGPMRAFGWGESLYAYIQHAPRDHLWVREAWRSSGSVDSSPPRDIPASALVIYEADGTSSTLAGKLRPSMFMPRWASRITLEVTDVKVERLQDISEGDAKAEGAKIHIPSKSSVSGSTIPSDSFYFDEDESGRLYEGRTARDAYEILWGKINGWASWDANPWVVAYTFRPILANIDQIGA